MFYLLLLLGFIAMATGVFIVGFGIPIRETPFGAALLIAGCVAMTGGLVLVGLAAAVRELQRVVQGLKARFPGMPRPLRPMERKDGERNDSADKGPGPLRVPMPAAPGTEAANAMPTKFDAPDTLPLGLGRKAGPESLRRAMAEIESAPKPADPRSVEAAPAVSPQNMFDMVWPSERRKKEGGLEQRTEASSEMQIRPVETRLSPVAPLPPPPAPSPATPASVRPVRADPRPLPILKSGVIDEMAYTLFTDGSIEAQMPDGTMRFASIEELRQHLEKLED